MALALHIRGRRLGLDAGSYPVRVRDRGHKISPALQDWSSSRDGASKRSGRGILPLHFPQLANVWCVPPATTSCGAQCWKRVELKGYRFPVLLPLNPHWNTMSGHPKRTRTPLLYSSGERRAHTRQRQLGRDASPRQCLTGDFSSLAVTVTVS